MEPWNEANIPTLGVLGVLPEGLEIGVVLGELVVAWVLGKAGLEEFPGLGQMVELGFVAGEIVAVDGQFVMFGRGGEEHRFGFVRPLEFVQAVGALDPKLGFVGPKLAKGFAPVDAVFPAFRLEEIVHAGDLRGGMGLHFLGQAVQLRQRFRVHAQFHVAEEGLQQGFDRFHAMSMEKVNPFVTEM